MELNKIYQGNCLDFIKEIPSDAFIISDPFCGSGTILKVAKYLGRNYLGFELSENYIKIAEERLL